MLDLIASVKGVRVHVHVIVAISMRNHETGRTYNALRRLARLEIRGRTSEISTPIRPYARALSPACTRRSPLALVVDMHEEGTTRDEILGDLNAGRA